MASDSEQDEFFDAEDATPNRSILEVSVTQEQDEELAREERELLEQQKRLEEKRRKEDEELKQRLEALKKKKMSHKDKLMENKKSDDVEKRRRKHEELRRKMADKGENSDSTYSSSDSEFDDESGERFSEEDLPYDSSVHFSVQGTSTPSSTSVASSELGDKFTDYSVNINSTQPEKQKVSKHLQDLVDGSEPTTDTIDHNFDVEHNFNVQNIIEDVIHESQFLGDDNEPDIVRSTKTRTPPNTLQSTSQSYTPQSEQARNQSPTVTVTAPPNGGTSDVAQSQGKATFMEPVAPPRKKKKMKIATALLGSTEDVSTSQRSSVSSIPSTDGSDPKSPGLPPESWMRRDSNIEMDRLSVDMEHVLDLRTMIRSGRRHIKTEDAEMNAVKSDSDSPRQTLEAAGLSLAKKTSSLDREPRYGQSSSLDGENSQGSSLERDGKLSKRSSLERDGKLSKTSSMERRNSKHTSLERHAGSKNSSMDKSERRRSRTSSSRDTLPRKDSLNRPRSPSGNPLSDEDILCSVMIKNLDTGEMVPLKEAEQKLPKCVDPLVLHIMERTHEYPGNGGSDKDDDGRSESGHSQLSASGVMKKGKKLKKLFGKKVGKTVNKVKLVADQVIHGEESSTIVEGEISEDGRKYKFKANHNKKGPYDFGQLKLVQDLSGEHTGAVWCIKFSPCGRLLATGGQDSVLRIWVLDSAYNYFDDMRQKYVEMKVSPAPSRESLNSIPSVSSSDVSSMDLGATAETFEDKKGPFKTKPFCKYRGHTADLLDVTWSKNYFILSSSMDKTVRLWHISRRECLCTFQHVDFVTSIVFHPRDDRYFLSGSLDGKLRLWNIPDKKVTLWNEVGSGSLITTANFCHNGKFAVVGTYDGKCIFYSTEHLKYYTQIHVRSTRGKNSRGKKITGIEPLPGEDKVLVTSNDSRVRLYDLRDLTLTCKYKGPTNTSSQIRAGFSSKGKYIVCGSEDQFVYLWRTQHEFYKFSSARRDRSDYYEAFKVHNAVVTVAVFAPNSNHFLNIDEASSKKSKDTSSSENTAEFIVSADLMGCIKVVRAK